MRYQGELAYVLHARPWRETSLLVEVLSAEHGRVGLLARGVHGPKRQALRAALQPLQHIRFEAVQRGELATLSTAEAIDAAPRLEGERMLASFYLNELLLRLAPRNDPHRELYELYGIARARLGELAPLAWTLRRFERDLLDAMGSGFALDIDGDGAPIDPAARYRLDPEHGPRRLLGDRGRSDREQSVTGAALLALAADQQPPQAEDMPGLRRVLRTVLLHHLGGRGLKSWELLGQLQGVAERAGESAGAAQSGDDKVS
jgi:DNA repair protein RecO (recombination protein O)